MAHVILRSSIARLSGLPARLGQQVGPLTSSRVAAVCQIQVAGLKATYGDPYPYEKPWPYETKKLNVITEWFDSTKKRLNENSKIIIVEGNIGLGKNDFANRLAKNFDMKVFNSVPDDTCFKMPVSDFDIRDLDEMIPASWRQYDLKKFLQDPHPEKGAVGRLQLEWFKQRFFTYAHALEHMLNTGQGVIIVQSAYGDLAMQEALRKMGWVTRNYMNYYMDFRSNSLCELLQPHVTLYLDAPTNVIMDRIKKRNNPLEVNSKNINEDFVDAIRWAYENRFLEKMRRTGEVLEIDWSEVADDMDVEVIAEEMTRLHLESTDNDDPKFHDWIYLSEDMLAHYRRSFGKQHVLENLFSRPMPIECPEIMPDLEESAEVVRVYEAHPAMSTQPGWSPQLGHHVHFRL